LATLVAGGFGQGLGARGRGRGGRLGLRRAAHLEGDEGLVHFHDVAGIAVQRHDGARVGAGQLDGGLGRLNVHQGLVEDDGVADLHLPLDDLGLDQSFADVGQ